MSQVQDRFVDDKEVAKITGRAVQTLRNDRFRGQGIPYSKIGRLCRYKISDVLEFCESKRIETDPL
jgi:hypothetical protein